MTKAEIISEIISQLDSTVLENTEKCKRQVRRVVNAVFPIPWLHHPLKAGTIISRCRRDAPNLGKDSFGCKPAEIVEDYQRASIPHKTIFYGAVGDREVEDGEFIAMLETSKTHRNNIELGREEIYVSHWVVKQDIGMALISHPKVFVDSSIGSTVDEMQKNYIRLLPSYPADRDFIIEFDKLAEFVARQFAKRVKDGNNFEYLISAHFANNALETDYGIIYPSVQVYGKLGFNVALRPDIINSHLDFIDAEKHILYKAGNYMQVPANKYSDEHLAVSLGISSLDILPKIE